MPSLSNLESIMGMSSHVYGFIPPNDEWKKMKKVYDACQQAGINPPDAVSEFFDYEIPDPQGMKLSIQFAMKDYKADNESGFEVEISKLPENVKIIRFVNSY